MSDHVGLLEELREMVSNDRHRRYATGYLSTDAHDDLLKRTDAAIALMRAPVGAEPVEYQFRYVGGEWQRCGKTYYETLLKHPYDRATLDRMEVRALHDHAAMQQTTAEGDAK